MATKQQAEMFARREAFAFKQTMYVVARGAQFFAASNLDLREMGGEVVATFKPIKHRAGARKVAA